jgi:hypothetical protein
LFFVNGIRRRVLDPFLLIPTSTNGDGSSPPQVEIVPAEGAGDRAAEWPGKRYRTMNESTGVNVNAAIDTGITSASATTDTNLKMKFEQNAQGSPGVIR